ncbi:MAG: protein-methionine-sulfoxide reductase catalytic subunit MsrP, partial [Nitrospinaceae bacterium]
MSLIKIKKPWDVSDKEVNPESVYMRRREFLKGTALVTAATTAALYGCNSGPLPDPDAPIQFTDLEKTLYPAKLNKKVTEDHLDRPLTKEKVAASYNNFYEFSSNKVDPKYHAQRLVIRPWAVEVSGLVHKPRTFDIDDLLKTMPIEERMYRLRCVEAWAMAVPWTGFPLKALLDLVEPQSKATYVRMTTFYQPMTAQDQLKFWYPWPYTEGMTIEEASNELTFMATGIYGHPLPKQHGAPVRLVLPWKYGFKSIK